MGRGGSFCSGRKVCSIGGSGWKEASSGCCGAGCEAGRNKSKRSNFRGACSKEPIKRDTFKGVVAVVGGKDVGGRAMFCRMQDNLAYKDRDTCME